MFAFSHYFSRYLGWRKQLCRDWSGFAIIASFIGVIAGFFLLAIWNPFLGMIFSAVVGDLAYTAFGDFQKRLNNKFEQYEKASRIKRMIMRGKK